jgi:uncharacterized membrane protein
MPKLSPFHARLIMAIASLIGLFASGYLLYTYLSGVPIACGAGGGCDVVRLSKWAWTFGLPRPLLGVAFYLGVFGILIARAATAWQAGWLHRLTLAAAALGFVESAFLFLIQWLDIQAFCIWCLLSALAATVIALVAWFDRVEPSRIVTAEKELKAYFVSLLIFTPIALGLFAYLIRPRV